MKVSIGYKAFELSVLCPPRLPDQGINKPENHQVIPAIEFFAFCFQLVQYTLQHFVAAPLQLVAPPAGVFPVDYPVIQLC